MLVVLGQYFRGDGRVRALGHSREESCGIDPGPVPRKDRRASPGRLRLWGSPRGEGSPRWSGRSDPARSGDCPMDGGRWDGGRSEVEIEPPPPGGGAGSLGGPVAGSNGRLIGGGPGA